MRFNTSAASTVAHQYMANSANLQSALGDYLKDACGGLENAYKETLGTGTNVNTLLSGGQFVNRTALALDQVETLNTSTRWMDQYLELKMINYMLFTQNVFITFMPYGKVTQVDSADLTDFEESACASNFLSWGWGDYLGPGMARLRWYKPTSRVMGDKNGAGSLSKSEKPPGVNLTAIAELKQVTDGEDYTFSVAQVIESSVRNFIQHDFSDDGVEDFSNDIVDRYENTLGDPNGIYTAPQL